jgi:hypothetical protein
MLLFWAVLFLANGGLTLRTVFAIDIVWGLTIALAPYSVWLQRRAKRSIEAGKAAPPAPRLRDYL